MRAEADEVETARAEHGRVVEVRGWVGHAWRERGEERVDGYLRTYVEEEIVVWW